MPEKLDTAIRDRLARQRTELANERTLLWYIRTAIGFFIIGVPAVWWMELPGVQALGVGTIKGVGSIFLIRLGCAVVDGQRISSLRYHDVACRNAQASGGRSTTG